MNVDTTTAIKGDNNQSEMTLEKLFKAKRLLDEIEKPLFSQPEITPSHIVPPDFTIINLPKPSKHRSKRLKKKLLKKIRASSFNGYNRVWCIMGVLYAHPTVIYQMRKEQTK